MSDGHQEHDSERDARDTEDEIDRRAILRRRALLVTTALAGVTLAVIASPASPVCVREAHAQRVSRPARADASSISITVSDASGNAENEAPTTDPTADELPDVEELPLEVIDATIPMAPVPHVCLSPYIDDDPPASSGCGCRRTG